MESLENIKHILTLNLPTLKHDYPIKYLGLFGSYARGEAHGNSDIDILVEFSEPVGWEIGGLALDLEALLGKKVDLVTRKAIKKRMIPFIEKELIYVSA